MPGTWLMSCSMPRRPNATRSRARRPSPSVSASGPAPPAHRVAFGQDNEFPHYRNHIPLDTSLQMLRRCWDWS